MNKTKDLINSLTGIILLGTGITYAYNQRPMPLLTKNYRFKKRGDDIIALSNEGNTALKTYDTILYHKSIPGGSHRISYKELLRENYVDKDTLFKLQEQPIPSPLRKHGYVPLLTVRKTLTENEIKEITTIIKETKLETQQDKFPFGYKYEFIPTDYIS